ncbi:MAG: FAD-dependent oxidoreductase [Desulfobacterales bacterium]|nr:FAD-dependent oxidoreductase [Desulfobacterales bacterium]
MFSDNGIEMVVDRVDSVDVQKKQIKTAGGRDIAYDKLMLATGSKPFVPPIPGADLEGVFTMRSLSDAEEIMGYLDKANPAKLLFVGAGFISLEVAALLKQVESKNYGIEIIELMDYPLPLMLDAELGEKIRDHLRENGFSLRMGQKVTKILGDNGRVSAVELDSGEKVDADMVFMNVGAKPNLELPKHMGLEMGQFGVKVNEFLETSNPDVLAAGDCIENYHFLTKKPVPIQLRGPAVIQGRLMAKRLAGYDIAFPGLLGNSAVKLFDKFVAATGFTETQARKEGFDPVSATVDSGSKHAMIPGMKPWTIKLVFDRGSQKLIGGQIISDSDAPVKEIDTVNALITGGKTIPELVTLMCAGNPDCSSEPSKEPITVAAEQALQKINPPA